MKTSNKIKLWTITLSILLIAGIVVISYGGKHYFGTKPREPKNQITTTYNIGWWAHQDSLTIDSFKVVIIDSRLNLFNSKSLISYNVKGTMKGSKSWKPQIEKTHISERFIRKYNRELHPYLEIDSNKTAEALIEITPIVKVDSDKSYNGESIAFEFTNELTIGSFHWGNNKIRIQCLDKFQDIELFQRK